MKNPQKRQDKKSTVPSSEVEITWNAEWHILPRLLQKVRAPSVHRTLGAMADIWHPTSGDSAVANRKPIFFTVDIWNRSAFSSARFIQGADTTTKLFALSMKCRHSIQLYPQPPLKREGQKRNSKRVGWTLSVAVVMRHFLVFTSSIRVWTQAMKSLSLFQCQIHPRRWYHDKAFCSVNEVPSFHTAVSTTQHC